MLLRPGRQRRGHDANGLGRSRARPDLTPVAQLWSAQQPNHTERDKLKNMSDVSRILYAIEQGEAHAADQLLPLVYDELRKLAAQKLAQERPGQTLEATALV